MAFSGVGKFLSDLTAQTAATDTDLVPIGAPGTLKKITFANLRKALGVDTINTSIGALTSLSTTTKTSLVDAINEIFTSVDTLNRNMSKWHMVRQTVTVPGGATAVNVSLSDMVTDCPVVAQRITNAGSVGVAGARAYAGYVTISLTDQVSASDAQVAFSVIYYC